MVLKLTFGDLRDACTAERQDAMPREVALAHLDLAALVMGCEWECSSAVPDDLAARFPADGAGGDTRLTRFGSLRRFENWQTAIFRLTVAVGGGSSGDPYVALEVLAAVDESSIDLSDMTVSLRRAFPGLEPGSITRECAIKADALLTGLDRTRLRNALHALDRLRLLPAVRERKLLCAKLIGNLPQRRASGRWEVTFPTQLSTFHARLDASHGSAFKAIFEAGVAAGYLEAEVDLRPEELLEPELFKQLESAVRNMHSRATGAAYVARVIQAIRKNNPDLPHPNGWLDLRERVRRLSPTMDLSALSHLATRSEGLAPHQLDQAWLDAILSGDDSRAKVLVRQGAHQMNKLRVLDPGALFAVLPAHPFVLPKSRTESLTLPPDLAEVFANWRVRTNASIKCQKAMRCALRTFHSCAPTESPLTISPASLEGIVGRATHLAAATQRGYQAALRSLTEYDNAIPAMQWKDSLSVAKDSRLSRRDIHALGAVRNAALRSQPPIGPDAVDHAWAVATLADITASTSRHRFRRGIQMLSSGENAKAKIALPIMLDPLPDARLCAKYDLPEHYLRDLNIHVAFRGLAANTGRAWRTALRLIIRVATDYGEVLPTSSLNAIPFGKLIGRLENDEEIQLPDGWPRARLLVLQLERELMFPWTQEWKQLQRLVVSAGVEAADNPVPDFAAAAIPAGLSPSSLDREWCWQHERSLRPDLQITWSRNVLRWDTLCGIPAISASRLIPPEPLGPMPGRGERAKHGLYPLPRTLEAALASQSSFEGMSRKQLNEAAHFLWRQARDQGIYIRGEEPDAAQMLGYEFVHRVLQHGAIGLGPGPLREHIRRLAVLSYYIPETEATWYGQDLIAPAE